jgi:Zn-dependent protease with chaperone function
MVQLSGFYYPPGSPRQTEAVARISDDGKSLQILAATGGMLAEAPLRYVVVTSRLGALRRKLEFPSGCVFETSDNDAVDALLKGDSYLLSRLEKSWRLAAISLLTIIAGVALFALYGAPLGAHWLALRTPPSLARLVTNETLAALDNHLLMPTALPAARQQDILARFHTVSGWEKHGGPHYRLLIRNAPHIGPNAFALPDGRIVITDQLVAMARNDVEIDAVFAHEMAHVNHAHGMQRVYQASLVPAAIAFITGDASQVTQFAAVLPGILLQSAYSRAFEQQADDDAATLLLQHGEGPGHLADLLERMERKSCGKGGCGPSWLGSHPATAERAARLRRARPP